MDLKDNPYAPLTEEQKRERAKESTDRAVEYNIVIAVAKRCLDHEDFKTYKTEFMRMREHLIKGMIETADPDPVRDAFATRARLNKISVLNDLLERVEEDAKRKPVETNNA